MMILRLALRSITRIFHQGKLRVLLDSDHEKRKAKVESFCLLIGLHPLWISHDSPEPYNVSVDWRESRDPAGSFSYIMTCKVKGRMSGKQICVHLDTLTGALWGEGLPVGSVLYSDEDSFVRLCLRLIQSP